MRFELREHHHNVSDQELIADLKKVAQELRKDAITMDEYDEVIRMAEELGFEYLLVQRMDSRLHNLPDFRKRENPFPLNKSCNEEISAQ